MKTLIMILAIIVLTILALNLAEKRFDRADTFWKEQEAHCPIAHIYENGDCIHIDSYGHNQE